MYQTVKNIFQTQQGAQGREGNFHFLLSVDTVWIFTTELYSRVTLSKKLEVKAIEQAKISYLVKLPLAAHPLSVM